MVSYHLFLKPGAELPNGKSVCKEDLDNLSLKLSKKLREAKKVLELMESAGFIPYMGMYEICFDHKKIDSEAEARKQIEHIGLNDEIFDYDF